jgi:hypothetical protein
MQDFALAPKTFWPTRIFDRKVFPWEEFMRARGNPGRDGFSLPAWIAILQLRARCSWAFAPGLLWALPAHAQTPTPTPTATPLNPPTPLDNSTFAYLLVVVVGVAILIAFSTIRSSLTPSSDPKATKWSLADALSEEADVTPLKEDGTPLLVGADGKPLLGSDGKAITVSKLTASTSRFIALLGLIGILIMYMGFGMVVLENYAQTGVAKSWSDLQGNAYFLFSGITMFAPYIVNKFSSVFDWLKPTR